MGSRKGGVDNGLEPDYVSGVLDSRGTDAFDTLTRRNNRPLVESTGERSALRALYRRFPIATDDEVARNRAKVKSRLTPRRPTGSAPEAEDQMVRTTTTENKQARATTQWFRAWDLLTLPQRLAVIAFCASADADVAEVALKV